MRKTIKKRLAFILAPLLVVTTISAFKTDFFEITKQIEIYNSLFKAINMNYVDQTNPAELMSSGVKKMLLNLDPYTVYGSEQDVENAKMRRSGDFVGIGADLRFIKGKLTVYELYKGLSADNAGLKPGDEIIKINGVDVLEQNQGVDILLGGKQNTEVEIVYLRNSKETLVKVRRGNKKPKAVPIFKISDSGVGYIALTGFSRGAAKEVESALKFLLIDEAKGLILDLRNNPGGLLQEAVNIVNLFVPKDQLVVSTRSYIKKYNKQFVTRQQPLSLDIPLVILVNEQSASASEIVAGALQDLDRAVIIGNQSFGKGLVQQPQPLPYGAQVKITISRYYTPSGRCIQAVDYRNKGKTGVAQRSKDQNVIFKTKKGRTVYGGGGIMPDINSGTRADFNLIRILKNNNFFFNYAVNYNKTNTGININKFALKEGDFKSFKNYCLAEGFNLETTTESYLKQALGASEDEGLAIITKTLENINNDLEREKEKVFNLLKLEVEQSLSEEIIKTNFYKEGMYEYALSNNHTIQAAKALLVKSDDYYNILE